MCGCEVCGHAKQLQRSLNVWRNRQSKDNPTHRRVMFKYQNEMLNLSTLRR